MPGFLSDKEKPNFSIANLSLYEEILALEMILKAETPKKMDGKTAVMEMKKDAFWLDHYKYSIFVYLGVALGYDN